MASQYFQPLMSSTIVFVYRYLLNCLWHGCVSSVSSSFFLFLFFMLLWSLFLSQKLHERERQMKWKVFSRSQKLYFYCLIFRFIRKQFREKKKLKKGTNGDWNIDSRRSRKMGPNIVQKPFRSVRLDWDVLSHSKRVS